MPKKCPRCKGEGWETLFGDGWGPGYTIGANRRPCVDCATFIHPDSRATIFSENQRMPSALNDAIAELEE
jgi:hypothetical protein